MRNYPNVKKMAEILGISESDFLYFLEGGYFEGSFTQVMKTEQYPHGYAFRDKHVKFIQSVKLPTAPSQFRVKKELLSVHKPCEEMTTAECMAIDCEHLVDGECNKKIEPVRAFEGQENELTGDGTGELMITVEGTAESIPDIIHLIDQVEKTEKPKRKYVRKAKQDNG